MSICLKLEMTLTYSFHITSLVVDVGVGAVNSQKIKLVLSFDCLKITSNNRRQEMFLGLIRWILLHHVPFYYTKVGCGVPHALEQGP